MKCPRGIIAVSVVFCSLFLTTVSVGTVYAGGVNGPWSADDMVSLSKKYAAQEAFLGCFARGNVPNSNQTIYRDDAISGKIFLNDRWLKERNDVPIGYVMSGGGDDGRLNCDGDRTMEGQSLAIMRELGWSDGITALCDMGATPTGMLDYSNTKCTDPSVSGYRAPSYDNVRKAIASKNTGIATDLPGGVQAGKNYSLTAPARYVTDWNAFQKRCNPGDAIEVMGLTDLRKKSDSSPVTSQDRAVLAVVNKDGSTSYISYSFKNTGNLNVFALADKESDGGAYSPSGCAELAGDMNSNAVAYAEYVKAGQKKTNNKLSGSESSNLGGTNDPTSTCVGGMLGWIICPVLELANSGMKLLAESLDTFMRFEPLIGTTQGDAVFAIWRIVVNIANLTLVIAFLVVIFSQATSIGLSAYGIKKMLPRIIAAAILINISFYLCAVLVDVFNIIGASIAGIVNSAMGAISTPEFMDGGSGTPGFWIAGIVQIVLGATALAISGSLGFILPFALSAFISLLMLFVVLAIRHTLALLLIMISPLAFAAMILPNTDGLFKKWWKALWTVLALYPIMMGLAYGSMLVSKILLTTTPVDGNGDPNGLPGLLYVTIALVITVAWIFALKFIVTWGSGFIGKIAGMVNDKNKGLIDRSSNWAKQKQKNSRANQFMAARRNAVNTNAQIRASKSFGGGLGKAVTRATMPFSKNARQIMSTQVDETNSKVHAQRVAHAKQDMQGEAYNAQDPGVRANLAREAARYARKGDRVKLDALLSHVADTGGDELQDVYTQLQDELGGRERLGRGGKYTDIMRKSTQYIHANHNGTLGAKNRGLMTALENGPDSDIQATMNSTGMQGYYNAMNGESIAGFTTNTAEAAARHVNEAALRAVIENEDIRAKAKKGTYRAFYEEYTRRYGFPPAGTPVPEPR